MSEMEDAPPTLDEVHITLEQFEDEIPRIVNDRFPYTTEWEARHGRRVVGRVTQHYEGGRLSTDYYLTAEGDRG